ncbi:type VI secretion system lipoprotein IglE [Facilibium subflavum]|uniref:type VI secretion system lipoprotein IglE n=1 Tax=Facilibium subflavum TaxID=2219058 RepID=UPI000E65DCDB|nr:type VI secretion system lipoprotein IglE [Facilibium subflavum]
MNQWVVKRIIYGVLILMGIIGLSGCAWIPWYHSTTISVKVNVSDKHKESAVTMIVMQPAAQKDFVAASYTSVAQQSLDKGVRRYVFLSGQDNKISMTVSDAPLAIYFILQRQPVSGWKYLIENPRGQSLDFTVDGNSVKKET